MGHPAAPLILQTLLPFQGTQTCMDHLPPKRPFAGFPLTRSTTLHTVAPTTRWVSDLRVFLSFTPTQPKLLSSLPGSGPDQASSPKFHDTFLALVPAPQLISLCLNYTEYFSATCKEP